MAFPEADLLSQLSELDDDATLWIAYSGGMDSHVLLHLMSHLLHQRRHQLRALHVNHGISADSDRWQDHCRRECRRLGVRFEGVRAKLKDSGDSLETRARDARYKIFERKLGPGDHLFLAHHQDDQMETMLFRLMRGTGLKGLAGMPAVRRLGRGRLCRPLLGFTRTQLQHYAREQKLQWVEDDSNQTTDFDRNYLRHQVLPLLESRWPGFRKNWLRTAELCAEADSEQQILTQADFQTVRTERPSRIEIAPLAQFSEPRQRRILRYWLQGLAEQHGFPQPEYAHLQRILTEVLPAADDARPQVSWSQGDAAIRIHRYRGQLYALLPFIHTPGKDRLWRLSGPCDLGRESGRLELEPVQENGLDPEQLGQLRVCFRSGGEAAKPFGRKTRPLKKILQEYHVPPWLRDRLPLLFLGDELVAVADIFITHKFLKKQGDKLYRIRWHRADIRCGY